MTNEGLANYYGGRAIRESKLGNARNAERLAQVAAHHALGDDEDRRKKKMLKGPARRRAWYLPGITNTPGACSCLLGIA